MSVVVDGYGESTEPFGEVGCVSGGERCGKFVEAGAGCGAEPGSGDVVENVKGALDGVLGLAESFALCEDEGGSRPAAQPPVPFGHAAADASARVRAC